MKPTAPLWNESSVFATTPCRVTPHHHAFVERKLGHLLRDTNRIERRARFALADEVRMRATVGRPEQKSLLGRFAEHTKSVIDLS
jgi:hypothetical protein